MGEENEESLTKSESATRQAVFLFPRDAVSNAFSKGDLHVYFDP